MAININSGTVYEIYKNFRIQFNNQIRLNDGNIYFVIGANGIGKSTFAKIISKFETYKVIIGQDFRGNYLLHPQETLFLPGNVKENIDFFLKKDISVSNVLDKYIIDKDLKKKLLDNYHDNSLSIQSNLSGGEKQILMFLRTILVYDRYANEFQGIVFDEPTKQLSFSVKNDIVNLFCELDIDNPLVFISHDFHFMHQMIEKFMRVKGGKVGILEFKEGSKKRIGNKNILIKEVTNLGYIEKDNRIDSWLDSLNKSEFLKGLFGITTKILSRIVEEKQLYKKNIFPKEDNRERYVVENVSLFYGGLFKLLLKDEKGQYLSVIHSSYVKKGDFISENNLLCI